MFTRQQIFTKEFLNECFTYENGFLYWKKRPLSHFKSEKSYKNFSKFINKKAGFFCNSKNSQTTYLNVEINNIAFKVHRIIWQMHYDGLDENYQIDHKDHNGLNNNLSNLRKVCCYINQRNKPLQTSNTTGINGVNWHKSANKWQVRITDLSGKRLDLGRFNSFEDAVKARKNAEKLYGYVV